MTKYKRWDIYYARVAYEDDPSTIKSRPVVITDSGDAYIIAYYTTSQSPKPGYPCYIIQHWQRAGLSKPSNIRLDRPLSLLPSDMLNRIGCLAEQDILLINLELARIANQ